MMSGKEVDQELVSKKPKVEPIDNAAEDSTPTKEVDAGTGGDQSRKNYSQIEVKKEENEEESDELVMDVDVTMQSDSEPSTQTPPNSSKVTESSPPHSTSLQVTDQNINNSFDSTTNTNYPSTIQGFNNKDGNGGGVNSNGDNEMLRELLRESEEKYRLAQIDFSRRENILLFRLKAKDQEMQEYINQLNELKVSIAPDSGKLRESLLDPAVNLLIKNLKKELDDSKRKLEDTQNDLNAWKFTPDSNTGKRLMAKCRMLYQENEELGKVITSGRTAKLESDLALQKSLTEEMKQSQSELDELVQELDEDVDGMQSTIYFLQKQLQEFQQQQSKD